MNTKPQTRTLTIIMCHHCSHYRDTSSSSSCIIINIQVFVSSLPNPLLSLFRPSVLLLRSLTKAVKSKQDQIQRLEDEIIRDTERRAQLDKKVEVGIA